MWTNIFDSASLHLCRGIEAVVGYYPVPCQVNAGRPALWATVALLFVVAICVRLVLRRRTKA